METRVLKSAITSPAGTFNLGELVNIPLSAISQGALSHSTGNGDEILTSSPHQSREGHFPLLPSCLYPQPQIALAVLAKPSGTEIQSYAMHFKMLDQTQIMERMSLGINVLGF